MKTIGKILAVGMVLLASHSFAQISTTSDQTISSATNSTGLQEMKDQPAEFKSTSEIRRELRAQGLEGKEYRQQLHRRVAARNEAEREHKMEQRAAAANRERAKEHRAAAADHAKTQEHREQHAQQAKKNNAHQKR